MSKPWNIPLPSFISLSFIHILITIKCSTLECPDLPSICILGQIVLFNYRSLVLVPGWPGVRSIWTWHPWMLPAWLIYLYTFLSFILSLSKTVLYVACVRGSISLLSLDIMSVCSSTRTKYRCFYKDPAQSFQQKVAEGPLLSHQLPWTLLPA